MRAVVQPHPRRVGPDNPLAWGHQPPCSGVAMSDTSIPGSRALLNAFRRENPNALQHCPMGRGIVLAAAPPPPRVRRARGNSNGLIRS
jgi:hypothetical protein